MWTRRRARRRSRRDLADHLARLAESDRWLREARAFHAELESWPTPLRCWLALQQRAESTASTAMSERPRLDLAGRGLPQVVDPAAAGSQRRVGVLTDLRFYIGVGVGVALVMFVIPWARGTMAARQGG